MPTAKVTCLIDVTAYGEIAKRSALLHHDSKSRTSLALWSTILQLTKKGFTSGQLYSGFIKLQKGSIVCH